MGLNASGNDSPADNHSSFGDEVGKITRGGEGAALRRCAMCRDADQQYSAEYRCPDGPPSHHVRRSEAGYAYRNTFKGTRDSLHSRLYGVKRNDDGFSGRSCKAAQHF
jgi:hypothetical protein